MPHVRVDIALRWGDQDEYGHINNVSHARYLEEARVRVFSNSDQADPTGLEILFAGADEAPHKTLLAAQHIEFIGVLRYAQCPAVIEMWIGKIGGSSFDVHAEIIDTSNSNQVVTRAISTLVVVDGATLLPKRLAAHEREVLRQWQGAPLSLRRI